MTRETGTRSLWRLALRGFAKFVAKCVAVSVAVSVVMTAGLCGAFAETAAPSLINPRVRPDPAGARPGPVRFLTTDNNPPFSFSGPDGALVGYGVDLARELCTEAKLVCTMQARRADLLMEGLLGGAGDAVIPAPAGSAEPGVAHSLPFLPQAARFATRRGAPAVAATVDGLASRTVGVVEGSPFATFLARFFPRTSAQPFASTGALLEALNRGTVDLAFADGAELAFWLNGVAANQCCDFVPGAFLDPVLFGPGLAVAVRAADGDLRRTFDTALARLDARGTLTELYQRYFPVPLF